MLKPCHAMVAWYRSWDQGSGHRLTSSAQGRWFSKIMMWRQRSWWEWFYGNISSIRHLTTVALRWPISASDQSLPLVRFQGCYDGDTCTTTDAEKVRLACIDAPEIKNRPRLRAIKMRPTAYDNSSSERSAENLRALVLGRLVGIRRITTDRYGRTIAELFVDNRNVGQQQVANGHALISQRYSSLCAWTARFWRFTLLWLDQSKPVGAWSLSNLRKQLGTYRLIQSCASQSSVDDHWHSASWEAQWICEEGFFTEWKLGNTPKKKSRNPAFGGVFFCLTTLSFYWFLASLAKQWLFSPWMDRITSRSPADFMRGIMFVNDRMWFWFEPSSENGRNRIPHSCPKHARWLTLTCSLFWLLLQQWVLFQLRYLFDLSLSIRHVGTPVIRTALPGIKPTNPTGRFKIKKFLLLISVMVELLSLQDQALNLPTDPDQRIRL